MRPSEALERLYGAHAERLLAFFLRRTADPQIAADLWSETFAQTVAGERRRRVLSGDPDADAALLFTIAQRQLAQYYRRGYAAQRAMNRLALERPDFGPDPAELLEHVVDLDELRSAVGAATQQIPPNLRDAVRLRVVDELAYGEVAARLSISEDAARARVSRGLRALQARLETEPPRTPATGQETR